MSRNILELSRDPALAASHACPDEPLDSAASGRSVRPEFADLRMSPARNRVAILHQDTVSEQPYRQAGALPARQAEESRRRETATGTGSSGPSARRTITVAVRTEHPIMRLGLEAMLRGRSDVVLAGPDAADGAADVVVFAPDASQRSTADWADAVRPNWVLVLAPDGASQTLLAAMRAGVRGFVSLCASGEELLTAVGSVHRGAFYLSPGLAPGLHAAMGRDPAAAPQSAPHAAPHMPTHAAPGQASLTAREISTLRLVAQGLTHRQVGRRLSLTETTVDTYVKRIRAKLCVGNKADLTRKAIALGLVSLSATAEGQPLRDSA